MKLIIINSRQIKFLSECINSLISTVPNLPFDIFIINEVEFREKTLNSIFGDFGQDDLLIIGDDIIFTEGWYEFLLANMKNGDIIGFSMLYPYSDTIQDTGYDLVRIGDDISLKAQNRGKISSSVSKFVFRECDSLNGCALYIKKHVIRRIPLVPLEGMNRWGEFLYIYKARNAGMKIIVLGHYLHHHGKSTKSNMEKRYSSESYLLEREIWTSIVNKFIDNKSIKNSLEIVLSDQLISTILSYKNILFFGAGTVSQTIFNRLNLYYFDKNVSYCSSLLEEEGKNFCNSQIVYYKNITYEDFDSIIITVFQKEYDLLDLIKDRVQKQEIYFIDQTTTSENILFNINRLK